MYGYDVPRYVKEYAKTWQQHDRFLRVRRSLDFPGMLILERKTRYVGEYGFIRGTDKQVQYKDGYRKVYRFWPNEIRYVLESLKCHDIQAQGGAKAVADRLDRMEEQEVELAYRARIAETEALSGEVYDTLGWLEGRKVSVPEKVS